MNQGPSDSSSVDRIQAALDEMVAQRRRQRQAAVAPATPPASSAPLPLPSERRPLLRWVLVGLLAVTVHAAGIYWYTQSKQSPRNLVLVVEPAPGPADHEAVAPTAATAELANTPATAPVSIQPGAFPATRSQVPSNAGVIEHNGKVIVVPASPPSHRPASARTVVAVPTAAPEPRAPAPSPAPSPRPSVQDHAEAAKEFAYYHFRYKYKAGSVSYAVTSQSVRISGTEEVSSWNRYRSTGEVGLEYYDNSGFRRTTRRFEVLTEDKDGQATAIEITVK